MEANKTIARRICAAVLKQAFDDWMSLECGEWEEKYDTGQVIYITELLVFFKSPEFEDMCRFVLRTPPSKIRAKLKIPVED